VASTSEQLLAGRHVTSPCGSCKRGHWDSAAYKANESAMTLLLQRFTKLGFAQIRVICELHSHGRARWLDEETRETSTPVSQHRKSARRRTDNNSSSSRSSSGGSGGGSRESRRSRSPSDPGGGGSSTNTNSSTGLHKSAPKHARSATKHSDDGQFVPGLGSSINASFLRFVCVVLYFS
jgi:hypothetical protein